MSEMHDFHTYEVEGIDIDGLALAIKDKINDKLPSKNHKINMSRFGISGRIIGYTFIFYVKQGKVEIRIDHGPEKDTIHLQHALDEQSAQVAGWLKDEIRNYIKWSLPDVHIAFPVTVADHQEKRKNPYGG